MLLVVGVLLLPLVIAVGGLVWGGGSLLLDAWHSRHPSPEVADRLFPLEFLGIADEARDWLDNQ